MRTVFSTGIAGCREKEYFKRFSDHCQERGKRVSIMNVTDYVVDIARESGEKINKHNLPNFPRSAREAWYSEAFSEILEALHSESADVAIVNAHVTYWWRSTPDNVVKSRSLLSFLEKLNPYLFLQTFDRPSEIKQRIDKVVEHIGRELTLEDILRWQETESFTTQIFAELCGKEFFLLFTEYPPDTLYKLLYTDCRRVYVSFPMTFLEEGEEVKELIEKLEEVCVVFHPIKDPCPVEDERLERVYGEHVIKRDYRLINQSDILVAFFPEPVYSAGVLTEMNYARSTGKRVYLISPGKHSPFDDYLAFKTFPDIDSCVEEIKLLSEAKS